MIDKRRNGHYEVLFVCLLVLCSVLVRFYLADFEKILSLYPDELRYVSIADNIAQGNGIKI